MHEREIKLNADQESAVSHKDGPLLIVAGAGTGKTTVLVERLARLVLSDGVKPDEILITTFTEKAAGEMEERADKILPYGYVDLWIHTFHGFCERILREHALDIGLSGNFRLLTQTEQWVLLRKNLDLFDLDYYRPLGNPSKFIHEILRHFSRLKDENISAQEYLGFASGLLQGEDMMLSGSKDKKSIRQPADKNKKEDIRSGNAIDAIEIKRINELANAFHTYNQLLLDNGYLDFGDLITYTIKLLRERPNILEYYHKKFRYLMVDEFQDTNWAQYELIKLLALPENNLTVVGDDDQAIYRFRGASMSNIMQFKDDFPQAREVVLSKNYRSGQAILDCAYCFIRNNDPNRLEVKLQIDKKLESGRVDNGEVAHLHFETEQDETEGIAAKIIELYNGEDIRWSDFAVLTRANDTAEKLTAELTRSGIPNQFVSMKGLYTKPVILDVIAYLKLLDNYHESSALYRVLNMENFKVSHPDIITINKFARTKNWSLFEALVNIRVIPGISAECAENVTKLLGLIRKHSLSVRKESPTRTYVNFAYDSGMLEGLDHDRDFIIFDYLNQFYRKMRDVEERIPGLTLKDFVELLDLEADAGETGNLKLSFADADTVKVMTVHGSKGLEFKYVFVAFLVDKKFPTINRGEKISIPDSLVKEKVTEGSTHLEEERRLFYVAMTRARDTLFLTSASDYGGARDKKVSRFIEEAGILFSEEKIKLGKKGKKVPFLDKIEALNGKKREYGFKYELPAKFSFSQLEAYGNCPLQYKFNFILKIPVLSKPVFVFGRVMHDTLRDFLLPALASSPSQQVLFKPAESPVGNGKPEFKLPELLAIYARNFQEQGYHSREEREKYRKKGKDILQKFFERYEKGGWPEVLFLEKSFTAKVGGHLMKGAIDRVDKLTDGTVEIIDYKTGAPKDKLEYQTKKQLILYHIALEGLFGLKASKLSFFYLENGEKLTFEASEKDIEKLKLEIAKQVEAISGCDFTPKPGPLCAYCDFRGICEFRK